MYIYALATPLPERDPPSARAPPLSSEQGTHKAVQTRFHVQTLIIHKLGSTKFTPQNDLDW